MTQFSVNLSSIVPELDLAPIYLPDDWETVPITIPEVNRPGLQMAGFYDYFDPARIQIIGKVEISYYFKLTPEQQEECLVRFFSSGIRVLIIAHIKSDDVIPPRVLELAVQYAVCVFRSEAVTSAFMAQTIICLNKWLAPRTLMHGVLMEIHGEGVLIMGESGVGKSETALALLQNGHRLVGDDAVEIRRLYGNQLIGTAPDLIQNFMEVRGIGVIDVRHLFGIGAVKPDKNIDLVVQFELWDEKKVYDRLGIDAQEMDILGIKVPLNVIPVRPGRNLAAILELAALNNREKKMGYNAAEVLVSRYEQIIDEG